MGVNALLNLKYLIIHHPQVVHANDAISSRKNAFLTFLNIFIFISTLLFCMSAPQSKNTVSTNIKHSRYIHLMSNFLSIHSHIKWLYVQFYMFDIVDTPFSYGRELIVCSSLQVFFHSKRKYSACDLKCRYCVFTLWGRCALAQLIMCPVCKARFHVHVLSCS